jgi:hypothetical protein
MRAMRVVQSGVLGFDAVKRTVEDASLDAYLGHKMAGDVSGKGSGVARAWMRESRVIHGLGK